MHHLITDDMLSAAANALAGHGMQSRTATTCICGHKETPVRRHLAQIVADTIAPSLTEDVMAMLMQLMAHPAPAAGSARKPRRPQGDNAAGEKPRTTDLDPVAGRGRRFGFRD